MTQTLIPFRETRKRSELHVGPYYGHQLKRAIEKEPEVSIVERYADRAWWVVVALAVVSVGIAVMIVWAI